jgi:ATP-dependent Clp protease ATP-binding subunit ClpA
MFNKYTIGSLRVIKNAKKIAVKQNFHQMHSRHLLLSIINAKESIASKMLCEMYLVNELEIKTKIINILVHNTDLPIKTSLNCSAFSPKTLRIFTNARIEAHKLEQNFISVNHLLLALLLENDLPDIRATLIKKMEEVKITSLSVTVPCFIFNKKFQLKLTKYLALSCIIAFICHKIYYVMLFIRGFYYVANFLEKRYS